MPDTHINAYFGAVEEAKLKLGTAQSELDSAERALESKKIETGYKDPAEKPPKASKPEVVPAEKIPVRVNKQATTKK